jgi:putative flavoprotein involved in K+ transport
MSLMKTDTIIIGGGQAGLSVSYYLTLNSVQHIVLEQTSRPGNAWRNDRWDSFTLVTPNWFFRLPGLEYSGDEPERYMPKGEIVTQFEQYVERFRLPVHFNTRVTAVEQNKEKDGYLVSTEDSLIEARNVVVATGAYQTHKIPAFDSTISRNVTQLHSGQYRNPQNLPEGAVLVVGSGQSGCQIAQELYQSGRKVYLCLGSGGRAPRRYRGKDIFEWLELIGFLNQTLDKLPSPQAKFSANPQVSGKDGGTNLNLHQFARDGVTLLGKLVDACDNTIWLAPDMKENLAKADKFEADIVKQIDEYILKSGMQVPSEILPVMNDGYNQSEILELYINKEGITSIIWAMGYSFDYSLVKLPVFDNDGLPIQQRGVTEYPGLFFIGQLWLDKRKSLLLGGVGEHAEYIANAIVRR